MKFINLLICLLIISFGVRAQAQLPSMMVATENATNILTWFCQFDGVKTIAVQRSSDSVRNFISIGTLNSPKKGTQSYTDTHPAVGKNYYRLSVTFNGDMEWFSNTYKVELDSATIAESLLKRIASGSTKATTGSNTVKSISTNSSTETTAVTDFYFTPSSKIYTNPYTGHININLEDALSKRYSLRFYDPSKNEVLRVSRISKTMLILDKNNFNSRGIYSFQLFEGTTIVETGYVNVY